MFMETVFCSRSWGDLVEAEEHTLFRTVIQLNTTTGEAVAAVALS
jgi:hypothetical protein